jgi:hypothetical protein
VAVVVEVARLAASVKGVRKAIGMCMRKKRKTSVERMYERGGCGQTACVNNVAGVKASTNDGPLKGMMTIEPADRSYRRLAAADFQGCANNVPRDTATA